MDETGTRWCLETGVDKGPVGSYLFLSGLIGNIHTHFGTTLNPFYPWAITSMDYKIVIGWDSG